LPLSFVRFSVNHHPLLYDQVEASTIYDRNALVLLPLQVEQQHTDLRVVLSALVPASIADSMKDEVFQAASNTLKTVAVRRRTGNLR
jgi:hypothetical protein